MKSGEKVDIKIPLQRDKETRWHASLMLLSPFFFGSTLYSSLNFDHMFLVPLYTISFFFSHDSMNIVSKNSLDLKLTNLIFKMFRKQVFEFKYLLNTKFKFSESQ